MARLRESTKYIIIHCSDTPSDMDIGVKEIDRWHRERGFFKIGYHFVIRRNGKIENGRDLDQHGAHVQNMNSVSVGICLIGGRPKGGFTVEQWLVLRELCNKLLEVYPDAIVAGHNQFNANKSCPTFNVPEWWAQTRVN